MRPRAGTHPVTLDPSRVVEILALARRHDEWLQEIQQDLFRAETKLNMEHAWRWPIRAACVAVGAVGLAAWQNDRVREGFLSFLGSVVGNVRESGIETMVWTSVVVSVVALVAILVRRWVRGPTPEQRARKLMEEFARTDGVASYVFSGETSAEDEAETVGALTRPENKAFRQRRLTQDNRPLASQLTRILNRQLDSSGQLCQREPTPQLESPMKIVERV